MLQCGLRDFEATINSGNEIYFCRVHLPKYPEFNASSLITSVNLAEKFRHIDVTSWLTTFTSTSEFYNGLIELIGQKALPSRSCFFYNSIYSEVNKIGLEAVLSENLTSLEISHIDFMGRPHVILVGIPPNYPQEAAVVKEHNLPLTENLTFVQDHSGFDGKTTLLEIYYEFKSLIETFQEFWGIMETFDLSCWVLEPTVPRLCDFNRRISITEDCSALFKFNPYQPRQCPSIEFRGSQQKVCELRKTLAKNLLEDVWDAEVDLYLNILSILDMQCLPSKESDMVEMEEALVKPGECGICFEDRNEGEGASERCQNGKCNSQYHQSCLLKYLRSTANLLRIKNAVMGKCPTCRETIGCPSVAHRGCGGGPPRTLEF